MSKNALLLEDDIDTGLLLNALLTNSGYQVNLCETIAEAKEELNENHTDIDLLFFDYNLPDGDSMDLLNTYSKTIPSILCSAYLSEEEIEAAKNQGALACIKKPFDTKEILELIQSI